MTIHRLDNQITKSKVSLHDFLDGKAPVTKDTIDDMFGEDVGTTIRR
jgi:hypothetical protein